MTPGNPMESPFDRGEVDRASLDATERLRARLSSRPPAPPPSPVRGFLPWALAGALFVFVAGMVANPWFEARVRDKLPFAATIARQPAASAEIAALRERLARLENPAATPPAERLARTEAKIETSSDQIARDAERIDRLSADLAALTATHQADAERNQAATATAIAAADRAQAMLTLVLVRRAVDAGRPFGALDGALRRSFEALYPEPVKALAALGTAPVTLASLRRDFNALRPAIGARPVAGQRQSWWDSLTATISSAVSSPAPGTPQAAPEAAAAALARGDYGAAANQLRRLPNPPPALAFWLAAAERLQRGNQALAALEAASIVVPPVATVVAPSAAPVVPADAPAATSTNPRTSVVIEVPRHGGGSIGGAVREAIDLRPVFASVFRLLPSF